MVEVNTIDISTLIKIENNTQLMEKLFQLLILPRQKIQNIPILRGLNVAETPESVNCEIFHNFELGLLIGAGWYH